MQTLLQSPELSPVASNTTAHSLATTDLSAIDLPTVDREVYGPQQSVMTHTINLLKHYITDPQVQLGKDGNVVLICGARIMRSLEWLDESNQAINCGRGNLVQFAVSAVSASIRNYNYVLDQHGALSINSLGEKLMRTFEDAKSILNKAVEHLSQGSIASGNAEATSASEFAEFRKLSEEACRCIITRLR